MGKRIMFIDTETGGLSPEVNSLLTIGVVIYEDGNILHQSELLISKDDYNCDPQAMAINKINLDELRISGMSELAVINQITDLCKAYFGSQKVILAGHNVPFDIGFLQALFTRNNVKFHQYFSYRSIDTMSILLFLYYSNKIDKYIGKLDDAIEYFNLSITGEHRHTALADTLVTVALFDKLIKL